MRLVFFEIRDAARFASTREAMADCRRRGDIIALIGEHMLGGLDADIYIIGKESSFEAGWRQRAVDELCARFRIHRACAYRAVGPLIVPWDIVANSAPPWFSL
ncbi:MAG TPA: hypothetical protein VFE31_16595 [Opitutaceae bacterium]|jgi:hypothetical protein|nr:hypothetical protein [Opitutaceae bacterium]